MSFLYDTHAHLDDEQFDADRDEVISQMAEAGVGLINNIGADLASSRASLALAEKYDFIYAAVGVHPSETVGMTDADIDELRNLAKHEKAVAIGEIGLDYHYEGTNCEEQKVWLAAQLELARELDMPVVIHDRESKGECIDILKKSGVRRGVIHCFSGSAETARELVKLGFHISFTGVVTFKNARRAIEAAKAVPVERLLIETDCPYMAPEPYRGTRNDSRRVVRVAEKLAELKGLPLDELISVTAKNGMELFGTSRPTQF